VTQPGYVSPPSPGWWVRTDRVGTSETGFDWETSMAGYPPKQEYWRSLRIANPKVGPQAMRNKFRRKPRAVPLGRPLNSAVGTIVTGQGTRTGNFTAPLGADVFLAVNSQYDGTAITLSATYNGNAMTSVGMCYDNNISTRGVVQMFYAPTAGTGASQPWTVTVSYSAGYTIVVPLAYSKVSTVFPAQTQGSTGTSFTQPTTLSGGSTFVELIGCQGYAGISSSTGGTLLASRDFGSGGSLVVRESITDTTFTAAFTANNSFAGVGVPLG